MVKLAELQPGDVVITMVNETTAGHASIYTGVSDLGPTIVHAVNDDKKDIHKLMATSLLPNGMYLIFRCRSPLLKRRAVKYAKRWAQYETPYDPARINLKQALMSMIAMEGVGLDDVDRRIEIQRRLFNEQGQFRAIKFAARRKYALCYPGDDELASNGRGLTCTMFAILCYQVAGLADHVNAFETPNPLHRVSDKRLSGDDLESLRMVLSKGGFQQRDLQAFQAYFSRIHSPNPYNINWELVSRESMKSPKSYASVTSFMIYPSILFWRDPKGQPINSFDFGAAFTEAMKLDAKITSPTDLMLSLRKDAAGWEPMGLLEEEPVLLSQSQKENYQRLLRENSEKATAKRLEVKQAIERRKLHPVLAWLTGMSHV